ncbi:hypothetical protein ACFPIF_15585 [Brevundimonas faecalis]|uniref:hypothetical protein n=1 Tax=Brevundimonas faecalis TaxID=947378 RepID=UPI00361558A0
MILPDQHWETWTDEETAWWLDGELEESVIVYPGDRCLFEKMPHGGLVLREVQSRGLPQ